MSIGEWNGKTIEPVSEGSVTSENGETWRNFVIFSRKSFEDAGYIVPEKPGTYWDAEWHMTFPDPEYKKADDQYWADVEAICDEAVQLSGLRRMSRGPGQAFAHAPGARIMKRFIVVSQNGGLDI